VYMHVFCLLTSIVLQKSSVVLVYTGVLYWVRPCLYFADDGFNFEVWLFS